MQTVTLAILKVSRADIRLYNVGYVKNSWAVSVRTDNITDKRYSEYTTLRFDGAKTFHPSPESKVSYPPQLQLHI